MAIIGFAHIHYGVKDVAESTRFFEDFGLPLIEKSEKYALFQLAEGTYVDFRPMGDPALAKSKLMSDGVQEVVWGVDSKESLDRLVADLSRDHEIREDADGSVHLVTDFGQAVGLKVYNKQFVVAAPGPANTAGNVNRINQWRKWRKRAQPKGIEHLGFHYPDVNQALDFYRGRLHFRVTEVQNGNGLYLRCDGSTEHHHLALVDAEIPFLNSSGKLTFNHVNYRVEDIDEIMAGKMYMERKGWPPSNIGLGRHRIGSGAFLYLPCPAGGEAEYGADIDHVDDTWVPHVWTTMFGFLLWGHNLPPFLQVEQEWALGFCDGDTVRHIPYKEFIAQQEALKRAAE